MKKNVMLLFIFLLQPVFVAAQAINSSQASKLLESIPSEKIFIHYNSTLLFAGEYLYYKFYTLNTETQNLSELSKVAYLKLVGENGNEVFKHKILLKNGVGQGDFFIPTGVASGKYKLVGYTNWMKNQGNFFAGNLIIINPYRGDQSAITAATKKNSLSEKRTAEGYTSNSYAPPAQPPASYKINLKKSLFNKRDKVEMDFEGISGNFSLSVRIKDSLDIPKSHSAENFNSESTNGIKSKDSIFIPELRGNLLSGSITSESKVNLGGKKIAFSIPGENYIFKIATTDNAGRFYINLDAQYAASEALMQIIGENATNFTLHLDPTPNIQPPTLTYPDFDISPNLEQWIINRSVYNQIENAYYSVKPDTLKVINTEDPFYTVKPEVYDLDAYTRFKTIKETFVEIIKFSWTATRKNSKSEIVVRQPEGATNFNIPALLLVDGLMLQDHDLFINYPAHAVQSIKILRNNFFLGSHIFAGIIDVETIQGDFWKNLDSDRIKTVNLDTPQPKKYYFKQSYDESLAAKKERLPDFRTQLLWEPSLNLNAEKSKVEFYTSDIPGTYEIRLEGFTKEGIPVSAKEKFSVVAE